MGSGVLPPSFEPPAGGERKLATILFADLVGSTAMADSQDPERTRLVLDRFYDAMGSEIERAGGTLEKFIGDAVVAVFGAPAAQEDHADRALQAALAMRRRLAELFGDRLALRIGVNTGEVVLGRAREGSSFVTGDPVNVAARLEQAAGPGEIFVGERTISATRGSFEFGETTTLEAKGKPQGVACRPLVRALSSARPRVGRSAALVARATELDLLRDGYRATVDGHRPHRVTILGDAGVGKTRLVRELRQWLLVQEPRPTLYSGDCLSYGQGLTYRPLGEILREHLGILEGDPEDVVLGGLGTLRILGLMLGLDVAGDLHPLVARDRLHDAWVDLIRELLADGPAVLLVEDLHWAEDDLLDLLERTVSETSGPLLLLCTARPELIEARPGWGDARDGTTTLPLEPLSGEDPGRLLDALIGVELPPSIRRVFDRAEGNPLFIEELLETLIDRGVLIQEDGGWSSREVPEDLYLPDSVRAVLAARIDLLAPPDKAALQAASVVGRIFWTGPIHDMLAHGEPDLRVLEERGFIQQRPDPSIAGEREFAFKHQLTRDVAYGSLTMARRARLHAALAGWIEGLSGAGNEHASLLAHHYAEAVRPEEADVAWADAEEEHARLVIKAVASLRRAAELATGRHELRDALSLLDGALALASDEEKIQILRQQGLVHIFNYDPESFRAALERALELHPSHGVEADILAGLALYGRGRPYMWRQPPPTELADRWLARALELAQPGSRARATALLASALAAPETGAEQAAEARAIAERSGDRLLLNGAFEAQAHVASAADRYREASRWAERALEGADAQPDMHPYWAGGFFYLRAGRIADVHELADRCDRMAERMTSHDEVHAVALRALLYSSVGRWADVAGLAGRAERASDANAETPCQFNWRTLLVCALALEHLGERPAAQRLVEVGRGRAEVAGPVEREPALLRLALIRGDLDEARTIIERMPSVDPWGLDGPAARLDALVALGDRAGVEEIAARFMDEESYYRPFALRAIGQVRRERALVASSLPLFESMGLEWQAERTRELLEAS